MYLLQKYDALQGADHAEFLNKEVPPWHISDDTCGPLPEPPVPGLLDLHSKSMRPGGLRHVPWGQVVAESRPEVLRGSLLEHVACGPPLPEHLARGGGVERLAAAPHAGGCGALGLLLGRAHVERKSAIVERRTRVRQLTPRSWRRPESP